MMAETKHTVQIRACRSAQRLPHRPRSENSPLVQISSNPLQIGPLLNATSMTPNSWSVGPSPRWASSSTVARTSGVSSVSRNYYPVLIQVFCKELLGLIHEQVQQTGKVPPSISTALVERALNSSDVKSKLFQILREGRSRRSRAATNSSPTFWRSAKSSNADSGMDAGGNVRRGGCDRAMECWPAAFPRGSDALGIRTAARGNGGGSASHAGRFPAVSRFGPAACSN